MRDAGADAAEVGYLWRSMCILWMTSSLSSHSTCASVSERSRLVTHTAVSSPKCNSEKRPLSNSVAFRTLFKWHRYCGILKIHIVRKKNTGIRYEPVYRPALVFSHHNLFWIDSYSFWIVSSGLLSIKTSASHSSLQNYPAVSNWIGFMTPYFLHFTTGVCN